MVAGQVREHLKIRSNMICSEKPLDLFKGCLTLNNLLTDSLGIFERHLPLPVHTSLTDGWRPFRAVAGNRTGRNEVVVHCVPGYPTWLARLWCIPLAGKLGSRLSGLLR